MDTAQQHHEDERADDTGADDTTPLAMAPSRPDDPAVIAAAAGRTTRERSSENERQRQPSQRHNRGPPLDDDDDEPGERLAGDLLVGFDAIQKYLAHLGMPADIDIYRLRREKLWPIGKTAGTGGSLIASKRRLARYAQKLTAPSKSDAA